MKRCGFTLAELVISIGIIGLIGALTAPLVGKIMPDKNKALFLKAYDTTLEIVSRMANDTSLFTQKYNYNDGGSIIKLNIIGYPLLDDSTNKNTNFEAASGKAKFCQLFAEFLEVSSPNCSDSGYTYNTSNFNAQFLSNSFETKNGMRWWIIPQLNRIEKKVSGTNTYYETKYQTDIYVDVNPTSSGKDCFYHKDNCKSPDRFKFMIDAKGNVTTGDPAGTYYKTHRASLSRGNLTNEVTSHALTKLKSTVTDGQVKEVKVPN